MDGDGPCQSDGELGECAQFFFFNLLLFLIIGIADVPPDFPFDIAFPSVIGNDVNGALVFIDACDHANSAVDPPFVHVILDKDDLGAGLQLQFHGCRKAVGGKFAMDFSGEGHRFSGKFRQMFVIDIVHLVTSGGKCDAHVVGLGFSIRVDTCIEQLQVGDAGRIVADTVQHIHKDRVTLPVDFMQLDADQFNLIEDAG